MPYILHFFLPWACASCRTHLGSREDTGFCATCWLGLPRIQGHVCQRCGIPLRDGGRQCFGCRQAPVPLVIRAATRYEDALCPAIQRFKYMGRKSLALSLGLLLREAWMRYPELHEVQGYVPVPLHARNERVRGYNQADLLAKALAAYTGRPVLNLLQRVRQTKAQVSLAKAQRQCNIVGAFCLREEAFAQLTRLQKRPLLLIDDVCTTSSTLAECGLTLRRAGIKRVHALVLARDL